MESPLWGIHLGSEIGSKLTGTNRCSLPGWSIILVISSLYIHIHISEEPWDKPIPWPGRTSRGVHSCGLSRKDPQMATDTGNPTNYLVRFWSEKLFKHIETAGIAFKLYTSQKPLSLSLLRRAWIFVGYFASVICPRFAKAAKAAAARSWTIYIIMLGRLPAGRKPTSAQWNGSWVPRLAKHIKPLWMSALTWDVWHLASPNHQEPSSFIPH